MLSRLTQPFLTIMPLSASNKRALTQFGRATKWGQTLKAEYTTILISLIKGSADGLTGEVYTHLKIVFGENPKTILPEYNCNQDLVF